MFRLLAAVLSLCLAAAPAAAQSREEIERTMRRATEYMVEEVSTEGGYLWSYLPDMSRRWGEAEAYPTMIWIQPPGTATMGQLFLDAYHATGDEYYYRAAERVGEALARGQHASGGWGYFIDFGGPASTRRWYETIGRNAWRMEEFFHPADDATFDDAGTVEAGIFLLRLYLEKNDPRFRAPLDRAIGFVLDSQYPIGGWPQRWPPDPDQPDYARMITFNDDVASENIRFLLLAWQVFGGERIRDAIVRGMNAFLVTQQGPPQAGWALQHGLDLKPAAARTYEPLALSTHTTAANVKQLMHFYRLTGESKFLARIPEALDWLESVRLSPDQVREGRAFPTFIELGTNRPIYVHRRGSNAANGEYYWDHDSEATIGHYSAFRAIDLTALRREYDDLRRISAETLRASSPMFAPRPEPLPRYMVSEVAAGSDLNASGGGSPAEIIASLNAQGWWPTPLRATSNPYSGPPPAEVSPGDYRTTHVGDSSDTSPYTTDRPVTGISTATYIANMARLIAALDATD
ncbi:pectate lyase [Sphingosinicella sp. CPCC 101087]|uniref:pectate lyase n=1 Tax=Sphingosinicella sp. CPCC 101087 TaxID=2497754 RepID=UPI001FB13BB2|nr:pectate lyase [Sphingosinicella sp. CPCC 101087]